MVKISVKNFSEEALKKLYCDLNQCEEKCEECEECEQWDEACEECEMPTLLHSGNETCIKMSERERFEGWRLFR